VSEVDITAFFSSVSYGEGGGCDCLVKGARLLLFDEGSWDDGFVVTASITIISSLPSFPTLIYFHTKYIPSILLLLCYISKFIHTKPSSSDVLISGLATAADQLSNSVLYFVFELLSGKMQ